MQVMTVMWKLVVTVMNLMLLMMLQAEDEVLWHSRGGGPWVWDGLIKNQRASECICNAIWLWWGRITWSDSAFPHPSR